MVTLVVTMMTLVVTIMTLVVTMVTLVVTMVILVVTMVTLAVTKVTSGPTCHKCVLSDTKYDQSFHKSDPVVTTETLLTTRLSLVDTKKP